MRYALRTGGGWSGDLLAGWGDLAKEHRIRSSRIKFASPRKYKSPHLMDACLFSCSDGSVKPEDTTYLDFFTIDNFRKKMI